jgi:hypothetical protein
MEFLMQPLTSYRTYTVKQMCGENRRSARGMVTDSDGRILPLLLFLVVMDWVMESYRRQ